MREVENDQPQRVRDNLLDHARGSWRDQREHLEKTDLDEELSDNAMNN